MAGTTRNLLIVRPANKRPFIVTPGHFHVDPGDIIHWRTIGTGAHLTFPNITLFGQETLDIPMNGHEQLVVRTDVTAGIYPYSALCDATDEYAEGGSDPELIVCDGR